MLCWWQVLPRGKIVPNTGQKVEVSFGEPIYINDLWEAWHAGKLPDEVCYSAIASRIQLSLARLKAHDSALASK